MFLQKWLKTNAILVVACLLPQYNWGQDKYVELELIELSQMNNAQKNRFDLSGIARKDGRIYVVADKGWNNYIYEIGLQGNSWKAINTIRLGLTEPIDLEGLDYCNGSFYLINEYNNKVYTLDAKDHMKSVFIHYEGKGINPETWKKNTGLEAIAVNCEDAVLYLAKEREPRFLLEVDMRYGTIANQFTIPEVESNDFSDMKYENGFLYMLERNGSCISKIDVRSRTVVEKVSYKYTSNMPAGKLYEPTKYGMAEALLLTSDEIWIGIDNNGLKASKGAEDRFGLKGNQPSILRFKRPAGF